MLGYVDIYIYISWYSCWKMQVGYPWYIGNKTIYTKNNIYHIYIYMDYLMHCIGQYWTNIWGTTARVPSQGYPKFPLKRDIEILWSQHIFCSFRQISQLKSNDQANQANQWVNLALGTHIHTRFVGGVIECHKLNQTKAKMPQAHLNFMVKFWQRKKTSTICFVSFRFLQRSC